MKMRTRAPFSMPWRSLRGAPVDLRREVIDPACTAVWPAMAAAGMHLTVEMCGPAAQVHGDAYLLQRVVVTLLMNAVKHGFRGGRIELAVGNGGNGVTVSVWSEGRGFCVPARRGVTGWFRGLDPLHGCRRIVSLHGGAVWAKSEKRQWFEYWFTLPQPVATAAPFAERKASA